jgi:hypothetical protein
MGAWFVVLEKEVAAADRMFAEHPERIRREVRAVVSLGRATVSADIHRPSRPCAEADEAFLRVAPVLEVRP